MKIIDNALSQNDMEEVCRHIQNPNFPWQFNPNVVDEGNNWGNRAALLESYRTLVSFILDNDIEILIKHPW